MAKTRVAVLGAGYMGKFHAEKFSAIPDAELVAVVDADARRAAEVARGVKCAYTTDYRTVSHAPSGSGAVE